MRRTTVLLAVVCLALAGCSDSGSNDKPAPAVTVTKTKAPKLDATEQRKACVDAWATAIDDGASADDAPAECAQVPEGDQLDVYMEGLSERNRRAQASFQACTDDPASCPSEP